MTDPNLLDTLLFEMMTLQHTRHPDRSGWEYDGLVRRHPETGEPECVLDVWRVCQRDGAGGNVGWNRNTNWPHDPDGWILTPTERQAGVCCVDAWARWFLWHTRERSPRREWSTFPEATQDMATVIEDWSLTPTDLLTAAVACQREMMKGDE